MHKITHDRDGLPTLIKYTRTNSRSCIHRSLYPHSKNDYQILLHNIKLLAYLTFLIARGRSPIMAILDPIELAKNKYLARLRMMAGELYSKELSEQKPQAAKLKG